MKLFWKLYLGYTTLVLLTTVAVGLLVAQWLEQDNQALIRRELSARAHLLRDTVQDSLQPNAQGDPRLQGRVLALGEEIGTRFTVVLEDGTVIADSERDPSKLENHAKRPEFVGARRSGEAVTVTRYSHSLGVEMMYTAIPVQLDGRLVGMVRTSVPLTQIDERLAQLRQTVFLGALLALAVALVPGFLIARTITKPLASVTHAAGRLAAGEEAMIPAAAAGGEVGELTRAFASMAEQLEERFNVIESERSRLSAILASMVEGVVAVDHEERIVHLNGVAERLLGSDLVPVVGMPIWKATRVREVSELLSRTLESDAPTRQEVRISAQGGDTVLELHASPLLGGTDRAVAGAVLIIHDVTALRRLETLRRDFVANVSHELKTPLTAIYGLVETLLDDPEMEAATQRRFLHKVHKQAVRLSNLVGDVLTLSKVESSTGDSLELETLDLRDPIQASARMQISDDPNDQLEVELQTDLPADPVLVLGDREGLRQVVDNLLGNALKYTPVGGTVCLNLRTEDGFAVFEVQDTGLGIEPEHQERIFERFYRVDTARSRELGGTGLGLSIVKHVALAHGGTVSLESTPGAGSTFRVQLPLAATPAAR